MSAEEIQELSEMDSSVTQALIDRAVELENASIRLRASAEKVRTSQILNELVHLLNFKKDQSGALS